MQNSPPIFLMLLVAMGGLGLVAVISGRHLRPAAPSRIMTGVTLLPTLVMLGLFYSLAVHMHQSLDGWPRSIGEDGFPASLLTQEVSH
jgi:hypothetical protein